MRLCLLLTHYRAKASCGPAALGMLRALERMAVSYPYAILTRRLLASDSGAAWLRGCMSHDLNSPCATANAIAPMQWWCCGIRDGLQMAALTVAMGLGGYCVASTPAIGNARLAKRLGMGVIILRRFGCRQAEPTSTPTR